MQLPVFLQQVSEESRRVEVENAVWTEAQGWSLREGPRLALDQGLGHLPTPATSVAFPCCFPTRCRTQSPLHILPIPRGHAGLQIQQGLQTF